MNTPPPPIDYAALAPLIVLALTGVATLIIEMIRPKAANDAIVAVSLIGLLVAAFASFANLGVDPYDTAARMIKVDTFSTVSQLIILIGTAVSIGFSEPYLREKRIPFAEVYPLMVWSAVGAMILVSTENLLAMFVGLEILSVSLYVLAGLSRDEEGSQESAIKYFLLGAFASGFLLYGIALVYGAAGSVHLQTLLEVGAAGNANARLLATVGLGLLLVGFGFKASFAPFHQWTPDVYQGAPTNVTGFMAAVSKVGAIGALYRIVDHAGGFQAVWLPALSVIAILTMLWGNLVALKQTDVKRMLGYSSVGQAGYLLVGIIARGVAPDKVSASTTLYFLLSYTLMTVGSFAIISLAARRGRERTELSDFHGLAKQSPLAAFALVVFVSSLIGIPVTGGFLAKGFVFFDALQAGLTPLAIVLGVASAISAIYYLRLLRAAFTPAEDGAPERRAPISVGVAASATLCAASIIAIFFLFNPLGELLSRR